MLPTRTGCWVTYLELLDLKSILKTVQLLNRLDTFGMELVAACAEDVLDDVTVLKGIVNGLT